jgi:hypothetical protein
MNRDKKRAIIGQVSAFFLQRHMKTESIDWKKIYLQNEFRKNRNFFLHAGYFLSQLQVLNPKGRYAGHLRSAAVVIGTIPINPHHFL